MDDDTQVLTDRDKAVEIARARLGEIEAELKVSQENNSQAYQKLVRDLSSAREERDDARALFKQADERNRALESEFNRGSAYVRSSLVQLGEEIERGRTETARARAERDDLQRELARLRVLLDDANLAVARLGCALDEQDVVPKAVAASLRAELTNARVIHEAMGKTLSLSSEENWSLRRTLARCSSAILRLTREATVFQNQHQLLTAPAHALKQAIQEALSLDIRGPEILDLCAFFDAKAKWSAETFGPGDRYAGVIAHIRKELDEIAAKPTDLTEWIDVVLLAMDGAWRSANADGARFVEALIAKDAKNRNRTWPDWRTLKPDEVSEHVEPKNESRLPVGTMVRNSIGTAKGRVVEWVEGDEPLPERGEWYMIEHEPFVPGGGRRHKAERSVLVVDPLAPGTLILFMGGVREGRVVGPTAMHGMAGGEWYVVEHEPWTPGGPTRLAVSRDNMVIQKETAK